MGDVEDIAASPTPEPPPTDGPADAHPGDRNARPVIEAVTRRRFLGLAAVAGAVTLGGCSNVTGSVKDAAKSVSNPAVKADPAILAAMGPEPSSYVPPVPTSRPPSAGDPMELHAQVCVVGGGAAGAAAATIAGRLGAQTILLEESYMLGGNVTRGLVNLDKVAWGGQEKMVGGYFRELILEMEKTGHAIYPSEQTHWAVPFEVDAMRTLALELTRRAGVDVRLGAQAMWAEREGRLVRSVWAQERGRLLRVVADVYVDCTGDGNLGYLAGNGYWLGDRDQGAIQGQTLIFYAGPVDWTRLAAYAKEKGALTSNYQVIGLRDFMAKIVSEKRVVGTPQRGLLINRNMEPSFVSISGSEVYVNHLEPGTASAMLATLQQQDYQIHAALEAEVPGFEESHVVRLADRPYLREGRRLIGYKQLTVQQVLGGEKPADSIARGWYPVDLHMGQGGGPIHLGSLRGGDWYGIPYACLVARDVDNLLMAGRCISVTHEALGSTRISPVSMALGQAAGIAAALAASRPAKPADVPAGDIQREVVHQGGVL
jgi:FAD dependent oxidoreductase